MRRGAGAALADFLAAALLRPRLLAVAWQRLYSRRFSLATSLELSKELGELQHFDIVDPHKLLGYQPAQVLIIFRPLIAVIMCLNARATRKKV